MQSLRRMGACALAVIAVGVPAGATTVSFALVPQNPNAISDDAALTGRVTTDLRVNVPAGFDWSNAGVEIVLSTGSVYNATNAAATESAPNMALWSIPSLRNGEFDSFVSSKNFAAATVLGAFSGGTDQPPPAVGLTTNNASAVRVSWGNTAAGDDGLFTIGRFTLSSNATGTFGGRVFASDAVGTPVLFSGTVTNGAIAVPEPASLGLLAAVGGAPLVRRRRCRR